MARAVVVSVLGPDRLGIVAAMSRAIFDLGCNFERVGSTIIGGHFAMTMLARCEDEVDPSTVEASVASVAAELGLLAVVKVAEGAPDDTPTHVVAVAGADKPGIVYRVADTLARMRVNVVSLDMRTTDNGTASTCSLRIHVAAPAGARLEETLPALSEELGTDVTVRPAAD